ncbi:hypothetical protein HK405_010300, partial [Cladochytrium tenue]
DFLEVDDLSNDRLQQQQDGFFVEQHRRITDFNVPQQETIVSFLSAIANDPQLLLLQMEWLIAMAPMTVLNSDMQLTDFGQQANPDGATGELAVQNPGTQSPDSHSPRRANTNTQPAPGGDDGFTTDGPGRYHCNQCGKVMVRKTNMCAHILTHDPARPLFRCSVTTAAGAPQMRGISIPPTPPSVTVEQPPCGAAASATIAMAHTTAAAFAAIATTSSTTTTTTIDAGAIDALASPVGDAPYFTSKEH